MAEPSSSTPMAICCSRFRPRPHSRSTSPLCQGQQRGCRLVLGGLWSCSLVVGGTEGRREKGGLSHGQEPPSGSAPIRWDGNFPWVNRAGPGYLEFGSGIGHMDLMRRRVTPAAIVECIGQPVSQDPRPSFVRRGPVFRPGDKPAMPEYPLQDSGGAFPTGHGGPDNRQQGRSHQLPGTPVFRVRRLAQIILTINAHR